MHVIARKKLLEFGRKYPDSAQPLDRWYRIVKHNDYDSFAELKRTFPQADQVGKLTVFNIGGNKYRLIAYMAYNAKRVYVRDILTHADYEKEFSKAGL